MRALLPVATTLLLVTNLGASQAPAKPELGWGLGVRAAESFGVRAHRVFGERGALALKVMIDNRFDDAIAVDSDAIARSVTIRARQGVNELPTDVRWLTDAHVATPGAVTVLSMQRGDVVHLPPRGTLVWDVDLERLDGQSFAAGTHAIDIAVSGLGSAVRHDRNVEWQGRAFDGKARLDVTVVKPRTPGEMAAMHANAAGEHEIRGRFDDALFEMRQAFDADPASPSIRLRLAILYLDVESPGEAVRILEKLLQEAPTREARTAISQRLAYAHVAGGDTASAAAVLRGAGIYRDIRRE